MPADHDHFSGPQPWSLAGLTAVPGSELSFALAPYHPAEQARGTR
jgi:hypothetical protein